MPIKIILLFGGTILAFWISAITGGGASLILIPVLNGLLPGSVVPFALTIGTCTSSASRIAVFRRHIVWKTCWWFVPASIPAVLLGAYLIKYIDPLYLQGVVALFLLANLPQLFVSRKRQVAGERPYPTWVLAIVGALAGFVSGITGAIGLLFNRFYLKYGLTKEQIVATRAANEIVLHVIKLVIYILLGLWSGTALWLGLTIAVAAVVSSYTVKYILPHLSEFAFRKIGYGAMVASGLVLLIGTTGKVVEKDHIAVSRNRPDEATLQWRGSSFTLEYALDDGLEVERAITPEELPAHLKATYQELLPTYDRILLEKVFRLGHDPSYEFYAYREGKLTKLEYGEEEEGGQAP